MNPDEIPACKCGTTVSLTWNPILGRWQCATCLHLWSETTVSDTVSTTGVPE